MEYVKFTMQMSSLDAAFHFYFLLLYVTFNVIKMSCFMNMKFTRKMTKRTEKSSYELRNQPFKTETGNISKEKVFIFSYLIS